MSFYRVIDEEQISKDVERSGRGLFYPDLPRGIKENHERLQS
jgi:hypothetical protein